MSIPVKVVDSKKFDYAKFERDLRNSIKKKKSSMVWVSENICLRSPSYLATTVAEKRLPLKVVMAIANWAELDLREYEKKEEEKPKKVAPAEKKPEEKKEEEAPKTGWSCLVRVDEEFGMAMMKVFKDGEEIALGRSYTYGHDDAGIVQGISYAAHMCYKVVQQKKMAAESIKTGEVETDSVSLDLGLDEEEEMIGAGVGRVVFKDWIKKYEKDNSKAGKLARFVSSHYSSFPTTGKKRIRTFIQLNKGGVHIETFDSLWQMYLDWYRTQYDAGNARMGVAK